MAGGRKRGSQKKKKQKASPAKDHSLSHPQNESPLAEELTALSSIFQEDFTLISEDSSTEFSVVLRPHTDGGGSNISAELHVRCLPGYPHKPPKLQIKYMEGLSKDKLQLLQSLLVDQAHAISREGRVMVYNLVEAAREFLAEHVEINDLQKVEETSSLEGELHATVTNSEACGSLGSIGPFVYGFMDLFNELEDGLWTGNSKHMQEKHIEMVAGNSVTRSPFPSEFTNPLATKKSAQKPFTKNLDSRVVERDLSQKLSNKCENPDEKVEGADLSQGLQFSSISEFLENVYCSLPLELVEQSSASLLSSSSEPASEVKSFYLQEVSKASVRKDFLLAHLLQLVCCPRGPLPHAWRALTSQLQQIDIVPQKLLDLADSQPQHFRLAFQEIFAESIKEAANSSKGSSSIVSFWNASEELLRDKNNDYTKRNSRYASDFEELSVVGKGGFGHVVLCKNKLDGRLYAMKKIRLTDNTPSVNTKILREVTTLSRFQHHHIVRYYQAWFETVVGTVQWTSEVEASGVFDQTNSSFKPMAVKGSVFDSTDENFAERTYLHIQMEYCPRTLRGVLDSNTECLDEATAWTIFRQIVEGLAHIHGQGIMHRDLTPNNIFFDVRNDIKIGDFGLAKFTSLEQPDREGVLPSDVYGNSIDGTGQVGTYFYTAPEVGQGWPPIDDKADMYSLGVILFELWHPFETSMERFVVLNELKNKGVPLSWENEHPQQAVLVQSLLSANPADRPSAMYVLRNHLPPRMEDEALNDVLRTIQRAENFYVLDQIISALFDEERLALIAQKIEGEQLNQFSIARGFFQDQVLRIARDIFSLHGAQGFSTTTVSLVDQFPRGHTVTMIDSAGRMLELRSELRTHFARWIAANQVSSIKHFEISQVYRKAAGPNPPQEYYQGDFDIVGDPYGLAEAETIKVVVDILFRSSLNNLYDIHINHANILEAIWSWSGVKEHERNDVAKLLSLGGCAPPQSADRKSRWVHIRQQLLQGLNLQENVVDRLHLVERRWNGYTDLALSRLRGGLADSGQLSPAIDELFTLQSYLRAWNIDKHVHLDALMIPVEEYHKGIYFQVFLRKGTCLTTSSGGLLLAVGGRYDHLIQEHWTKSRAVSFPGAVGVSIALEKLILVAMSESEPDACDAGVLVCSKGGGGLLRERMEIVSELWNGSIKAEFMHLPAPSLTEQYDYANERGLKWLVMITEADLAHNNVKVRNMETRKVEDVPREDLVKFFTDLAAIVTNKRNRSIVGWK